jgi:hypothetical protein
LNVECFTTPGGKRWLAADDGENVIITTCASAGAACGCDPTYCPQARALTATLPPVGRRFDPMKPTIGDLVGKNINDSRMQISASLPWRPFDPKRPTVGDLVQAGQGVPAVTGATAWDTASAFSRFDPMRATVGDLVGIKSVEAAASGPPVVHRIGGVFDPTQPTVGDLVQGHTSRYGPPAGLQKCERLRSPFLTL